ncbi:Cyclin-Y-like [Oopsacas minuta]|uniref:Cyclin-Y-like n=1 Tax=Oopsacas minuta TaxID=111878 RepID=A0AAV7JBN1_9METZ|nr:Cyclin-Y-like [Oopsacas minuta]
MNAFENPHLYYYKLIPTGTIIVALCIIAAILWCCKKGRQNGDPVPKAQGDAERGAQPNPGSRAGSQESNQLESGETVDMLHLDVPNPGTSKITSPSKKYTRGASQTEELLDNTDECSPNSSFPTQESGQLFESATSASRGPITQLAPPNFQLESGQCGFLSRNTTGEIIKNNLYPFIHIPRTNTSPFPKPQPFASNDSLHCVSPYSQSQEKITTNSPLLDHTMYPPQRPTVVKIGDNFKFTEKHTLEGLRNTEIIVTSSIELQTSMNSNSSHKRCRPAEVEDDIVDVDVKKSRNSLNLEDSLRQVRQDTEDINNLGPQEMQNGESNEGSNLSDKSSMPSEVEISSSQKSYPNHETEKTSVRRKLPSDSMNDQDSDKSICIPIVSDEVRDRYQDGPRYILTPSLDSVSVGSSNTTDLMTKNSLPSLTHSSIIKDSPSNIQHIPDLVVAGPQKPDVIPGLTLDDYLSIEASQTEQLLDNTDECSPNSSFPTQEPGQLFESATSASRGPITQLAPPNFQLESGQWACKKSRTKHESLLTPEQNSETDTEYFIPIYPSLTDISEPEELIGSLFLGSFYFNNNNHLPIIGNHNGIRRSSSTSSVFIDSNTVAQPNMKHTLKSVALAVHNLLIFDSKNQQPRNLDVFDERLHPISSHNAICFDSCLIPETKTIYRFMKQLFYPAELTPECAIISLIYLERLLIYAGIHISVFTWKRILFGSILLASKVWNDKAVWNADYCQLFKELQVDDVNKMERDFFDLLQLDVNVPLSLYAKYYFDLRTLGQLNNISLPLELLTRQKAVQLEAISTHCDDDDFESFQLSTRSSSVGQIFPSKSYVVLD